MYRALSEIPVPASAHFIGKDAVKIDFSVRDNARDVKRSLSSFVYFGSQTVTTTPAVDLGDTISSTFAPSSSVCFPRQAVLRETKSKERYIEIWLGNTLEVSKDVTKSHGSFYSEEALSSLCFSPLELALIYVAEANAPKEESRKYKFQSTLGEGSSEKKRPSILLFHWDASRIPIQSSLISVSPQDMPDSVLFGQAAFSSRDISIIYATGYEYTRDERLLGLRWCTNHASGIWKLTLPSSPELVESHNTPPKGSSSLESEHTAETQFSLVRKLTPWNKSCRSPRIHFNASTKVETIFWLSCASGGPHAGTFSLCAADLGEQHHDVFSKAVVLVDTISEPRASDGFPGLYPDAGNLPISPFVYLGDTLHLVFSSAWGSRTTVLLISAVDGETKDLTPDSDGKLYSWSVLAADGHDQVVCSRSAPAVPHEIMLGKLDASGVVSWRVINTPHVLPSIQKALTDLNHSVIRIPDRGKAETVVFIHGGPHSVTTTAFSPTIAFMVLAGYTVSQPNYTGSVGFGETSVRALIGNCGTIDVQDCLATVRHLVSLGISAEGRGKQFVMGGSHGGFLTAHLIGQHPDVFTAAVIRNPVISTDPLSSDIPDWYFNEWNIEYPIYSSPQQDRFGNDESQVQRTLPPRRTPAESARIFNSSPIAYADAVTAHVLLHMGGSDLRVTPTHGREYYHILKGNARNRADETEQSKDQGNRLKKQDVEMYWFEKEGHSLDGVEANRIVWETSREWFDKYRA